MPVRLMENPEHVGVTPAIAAFENAIRGALDAFLSGARPLRRRPRGVSGAWRSFAPIASQLRSAAVDVQQALHIDPTATAALDRAWLKLEQSSDGAGDKDIAEVVAAGYRLLEQLREDRTAIAAQSDSLVSSRCIDPKDYSDRYLRPVSRLHEYADGKLRPFISALFLHGSLATLDFACDYSDFDTMIVLRRQVVTDADLLLRLLPVYRQSTCFLFEFDPLQHHAHILLTEMDLESYPDALFPLDVLDHARWLGGEWQPLRVRRRVSGMEMHAEFDRVCDAFSRLADEGYDPDNAYDLKSFLSEVMLLPALYLQCLGAPSYKKHSFAAAGADFSAEQWSVMVLASEMRAKWRYERRESGLRSAASALVGSPELARRLSENRASRVVKRFHESAGPDFAARAANLANAMRERVHRTPTGNPPR